jgi:hypothetical protein
MFCSIQLVSVHEGTDSATLQENLRLPNNNKKAVPLNPRHWDTAFAVQLTKTTSHDSVFFFEGTIARFSYSASNCTPTLGASCRRIHTWHAVRRAQTAERRRPAANWIPECRAEEGRARSPVSPYLLMQQKVLRPCLDHLQKVRIFSLSSSHNLWTHACNIKCR